MSDYFTLTAISKDRHIDLVTKHSDLYDFPELYELSYSEKKLEGNGSANSPYRLVVSVQNNSEKPFEGIIKLELGTAATPSVPSEDISFYLPGFMYGTNCGDKPWKVDCKFPRLRSSVTAPSDSDCPLSSFYMVRSDRLSHPCSLMFIKSGTPKILGFHTNPYYTEKDFIQYGGFCCNSARKTVGYTFGYENAPWLFVQSHMILPRQTSGNYFTLKPHQKIEQEFFVYDYAATSPLEIHKAIKNVYEAYHESPRKCSPVFDAIKDLSVAICDYAWLPAQNCYSGFVREDGFDSEGREKFSYNVIPSISWTNGIVVAYPQLKAATLLNNPKMREQALTCIQNIVDNSLNKNSSLPYESFNNDKWTCRGWWYDGMHNGGHSAYLDGQFVYYLLNAYQFEKQNGTVHKDWLELSKTVIASFERERNRAGEYPFSFSQKDGTGLEYDSLGSCWALAASCMFALVTKNHDTLPELEKSIKHYYETFVAQLECYGSPLDTDKAPDNEGILAFMRAAKCLHQLTAKKVYLDYLEEALYQEFTYKFCYNGRIEVPPLSEINWSSCGGSITSVCNPHIHPMSSSVAGEMKYFIEHTDNLEAKAYVQQRLEDTILWGCQTYNLCDCEYGYGKTGWMSERFCYSQGLVVEKYNDGRLASTWFALMPWASSSIIEGLLDIL